MCFVTIGLFLSAVLCSLAEETTPVIIIHNVVTTSHSTVQPEELISKLDKLNETVDNIKSNAQLSNWRSTTNSTSAPTDKKKASQKARVSQSTKRVQKNTTLSSTEEDLKNYEEFNLPENTAPHLYEVPTPWTITPQVKGFTGTYTRNPKYPPNQTFGNYTPPSNDEQYKNYQQLFHQPGQQQTYPQNYNLPPLQPPPPPPPPPPPRHGPQSEYQWQASQDQQQQNYYWQNPGSGQGSQQGFYYAPRQGPHTGLPPQGPPSPFMSGGQQPPSLMSEQPFNQQSGLNKQIPADANFDQGQFRPPRRQLRHRYNNQDQAAQCNDDQMNHTRSGQNRRRYYPRRWGQRYGQYQQRGQHWQYQYPQMPPVPPQMPPVPPQMPLPPIPPSVPSHQQMYPPPSSQDQYPPVPMPPQNWPQPPYYQQQPNNNGQRGYQPQPIDPNWQTYVNANPNWPSGGQNQQQNMRDPRFKYPPPPPQDPRIKQQLLSRNSNWQSPPPSPPPVPPYMLPPIPPPPQFNPNHP